MVAHERDENHEQNDGENEHSKNDEQSEHLVVWYLSFFNFLQGA